jgi:hypothetical protein
MNNSDDSACLRRSIYGVMIVIAVAAACGRILAVERLSDPGLARAPTAVLPEDEDPLDQEDLQQGDWRGPWPKDRPRPTPTLGDNDRSRWVTIRALVENHTYVVGHQNVDEQAVAAAVGRSLGLMVSPMGQGPLLSASSVPRRLTRDSGIVTHDGWRTIDKVLRPGTADFYSSKPPLLPTLLAGEYWLLHLFGLSIVADRWVVVRIILLTVNALPWAFYLLMFARMVERLGTTNWGRIFVVAAACFGTLMTPFLITLNNHTVAACAVVFALYPVICSLERELTRAEALCAGFFAGFAACNELPAAAFLALFCVLLLWRCPRQTLMYVIPAALLPVAAFFLTNWLAVGQLKPVYGEFGGDGWYDYEGSHWKADAVKHQGIDWAGEKESAGIYLVNLLVGHHGLFSLTPVFLLVVVSAARRLRGGDKVIGSTHPACSGRLTAVLWSTIVLLVIVLGFYAFWIGPRSRNYGGWSCGARWLLWLTPLLLLSAVPAADWFAGKRWGRWLCYFFLAVSVISASYPAWSPWRHPWLYNLLDAMGEIPYNQSS